MRKLVLAAAALAFLVPAPGPAAASGKAPCWQLLLNDYYDNGRVDATYRASCYREAIRRIPRPLQDYSDAYQVLTRSLASAMQTPRPKQQKDPVVPPATPPPPPPPGGSQKPAPQRPPAQTQTEPSPAPFTRVAETGSGSATAVPVPLLVLAGLGGVLTLAGAAGAIARRRRG